MGCGWVGGQVGDLIGEIGKLRMEWLDWNGWVELVRWFLAMTSKKETFFLNVLKIEYFISFCSS